MSSGIQDPLQEPAALLPLISPSQSNQNQNNNFSNGFSICSDTYIAVSVRNVRKSYGKVNVLLGLDMTVPMGAIYGLLGPSGCGKTTLLQCIVGKQSQKSGDIFVFGSRPGTRSSGVPGCRVGYMPQELAMYSEFSIKETLSYFGRIFNMSKERINERSDFLIGLLDLPNDNRMVGKLSGGQQRRASLAAALLHEPQLLILDEPTVGVDPLLRQCIWEHLLLVSKSKTTIIITTHYIEEARQANIVGMMRFGKLLSEDCPTKLLQEYEMTSLEDVFLHLCMQDEDKRNGRCEDEPKDLKPGHLTSIQDSSIHSPSATSSESHSLPSCFCDDFFRFHRFSALLIKNFTRMWRNIGFLVFQFLIPVIQVTVFCLAIGRDPNQLNIAIINDEMPLESKCTYYTNGCLMGTHDEFMDTFDFNIHPQNLSCRFMSHLHGVVPSYFMDKTTALESVRSGNTWGALHFSSNYSDALYERVFGIFQMKKPNNKTLSLSAVHAFLDMSNQHVTHMVKLRLSEAYVAFARDLLESCNIPPDLASLPVIFEEPVYGSNQSTFTEFMAPGVILSITYFMAVGLTAISFIIERKEGLLDRSWIAGVTATEIMLAHIVAQFVVMVVQVFFVLIFIIHVFEIPAQGSTVWIVGLTLLQGICGMSFGLVISALCDNEQDAIQLGLGSFYPNFLLSGIIWPIEGMPVILRYIALILPQTYACESMRSILSRGWDISWMQVYRGYLVTIAWTVTQLVSSAIILRMKRF